MNVVDDIKQKLDIVDVVSQYIKLQKSGRSFKANCPFHSEKTPSFFVFPDRQSWHCFGACSTGGDIFNFVMKKEGVDFSQALRILADRANIPLSQYTPQVTAEEREKQDRLFKINETAAIYFSSALSREPEAEIARQYVRKRGLTDAVVQKFQLGYSYNKWDDLSQFLIRSGHREDDIIATGLVVTRDTGGYYDRFRNRLIFPIRDSKGRVIGFGGRALDDSLPKYVNSPQTLLFDKSSVVYAIEQAQAAIKIKDAVVITEGYMDTITAHQFGFENTVASLGTALTDRQINVLRKLTKNIIVALDADAAGLEATVRSIATIDEQIPHEHWMPWVAGETYGQYVKYEIKVVEIEGGKDPDEIIRKKPENWAKLIEAAQPIIDFTLKKEVANIDITRYEDKKALVTKLLPILSAIKDTIRLDHYIHKLAGLLKISDKILFTEVHQYKIAEKKQADKRIQDLKKRISLIVSSRPLEKYALALILNFPELQTIGKTIHIEHFEHPENKDILLKWQENPDVLKIADMLDPAFYEYFHSLISLGKQLPSSLQHGKKERESALNDCKNRLQERYFKNLELQKEIVLLEEAGVGDAGSQIEALMAQGITESQQLKNIFRNRRRFFSRTKGT